ncbi:uncharacterized protein BKA78DRAFT_312725 [Phyllosticta capitalensis]|uniref:uncharacterized protein n=1 Tax=Phyllosticta capitalensis TaxID=121624 RepID=UPI003130C3B5
MIYYPTCIVFSPSLSVFSPNRAERYRRCLTTSLFHSTHKHLVSNENLVHGSSQIPLQHCPRNSCHFFQPCLRTQFTRSRKKVLMRNRKVEEQVRPKDRMLDDGKSVQACRCFSTQPQDNTARPKHQRPRLARVHQNALGRHHPLPDPPLLHLPQRHLRRIRPHLGQQLPRLQRLHRPLALCVQRHLGAVVVRCFFLPRGCRLVRPRVAAHADERVERVDGLRALGVFRLVPVVSIAVREFAQARC